MYVYHIIKMQLDIDIESTLRRSNASYTRGLIKGEGGQGVMLGHYGKNKKCNLTLAMSPLCNSICPLLLPTCLLVYFT